MKRVKKKNKINKETLGTLLALLTAIISGVAIIANKIFVSIKKDAGLYVTVEV